MTPVHYQPSPEQPERERPFLLITGRGLHQFNAGTMTRRSVTQQLRPTDTLEISPHDADQASIADGDPVWLTSRYGTSVLSAERSDRVRPGQLFATFAATRSRPSTSSPAPTVTARPTPPNTSSPPSPSPHDHPTRHPPMPTIHLDVAILWRNREQPADDRAHVGVTSSRDRPPLVDVFGSPLHCTGGFETGTKGPRSGVHQVGIEPTRPFGHEDLNLAASA